MAWKYWKCEEHCKNFITAITTLLNARIPNTGPHETWDHREHFASHFMLVLVYFSNLKLKITINYYGTRGQMLKQTPETPNTQKSAVAGLRGTFKFGRDPMMKYGPICLHCHLDTWTNKHWQLFEKCLVVVSRSWMVSYLKVTTFRQTDDDYHMSQWLGVPGRGCVAKYSEINEVFQLTNETCCLDSSSRRWPKRFLARF